jgi:two-component system NarL family sensor kinase
MNNQPAINGLTRLGLSAFLLALSWFFLPVASVAQPEFDQHLSYEQIQNLLNEGIKEANLRKQALAWYHWAYYDEVHTGISDSAFVYFDRSAERFIKAKDTTAYQRVRADLADRLIKRRLFDQAYRMYYEALDYFRLSNNLYLETHMLARLNRAYQSDGDTAKAKEYKRMYVAKNRILKDTVLEILALEDEIDKLRQRNQYRGARNISFRALQLAQHKQNDELINWAQYSIAENSRLDRDYKTALEYFKKAEHSGPSEIMLRNIYRGLSETYVAIDSLPKAIDYALQYGKLGDALLERGRFASLQQLVLRYESKKKEEVIKSLEQQKIEAESESQQQRLGLSALAVAFCALLLAMFFIVRDYRHRLRTDRVIAAQTAALSQQHIRELEDQLKIETMQSMLVGQESERRRIAQDLHDSVGGLLAATKIQVEKLASKSGQLSQQEDLLKIKTLLDNTVAETRHIARNMQPNTLLEFGLATALRDLTSHFRADGMPAISFQQFGDFSKLEHNLALNCYRIVQELLQNSLKHAKAREILVQITRTDHQLDLLVEDDGVGFEADKVKKGMGTDNIANRVQFLKGELNIESSKGQGTSTLVTIPLP